MTMFGGGMHGDHSKLVHSAVSVMPSLLERLVLLTFSRRMEETLTVHRLHLIAATRSQSCIYTTVR
jgi:hypothetical protein